MKFRFYLAVFLLGLFGAGTAQAISLLRFAKMSNDDQATYVTSLVEGTAKMLKNTGHPDQAQKALDLFGDASKNGGVTQFVIRLKEVNATNKKNAINPNNRAPVLQVEDAMALTLKDNGIIVPVSYLLTINQNFMPAAPKISQVINQ